MKTVESSDKPRHPIGVVSQRTGLPQDVLRAWERRYAAVVPQRTPTGRRLYTDLDIQRLRLLRDAVAGGRRISDVANLGVAELEALVGEDRSFDAKTTGKPRRASGKGGRHYDDCLKALDDLEATEHFKQVS